MNNLFVFAAQNTVVALVFAIFVYGLTRVWRNPPVAYVLWLLVLLKLVAPPVMLVDWSALRPPESTRSRGRRRTQSPTSGRPSRHGHVHTLPPHVARGVAARELLFVRKRRGIRRQLFWNGRFSAEGVVEVERYRLKGVFNSPCRGSRSSVKTEM